MTFFTAGAQTTLPIFILDSINLGSQLPVVNVVAFAVILLTAISRVDLRAAHPGAGHPEEGDMSVTWRTSSKIFVGGKWTDAAGGRTMEVLNPATGETIAEVPECTAADVDPAVEAARRALPEWLETTPAERAELLLKLADVLEANAEELAEIESRNVGKPLSYARDEMPICVDNLRFFAGAARIARGALGGRVHARLHVDASGASRSGSSAGSRRGTTR